MSKRSKRFVRLTVDTLPSLPFEKINSTRGAAKSYIDFDYLETLSPAERAWMQKFIREYYYASITPINSLHKTKEQTKKVDNDNSSRRRDVCNLKDVAKTMGSLKYEPAMCSPEDAIIEVYDLCHTTKKPK